VNVIAGVVSRYRWQGRLERDEESLLLIKCDESRVEPLIAALGELHPYDVPELLSLPVEKGNPAYVEWVRRESSDS
jgi:periplasmic divalent cation tolerance protein